MATDVCSFKVCGRVKKQWSLVSAGPVERIFGSFLREKAKRVSPLFKGRPYLVLYF